MTDREKRRHARAVTKRAKKPGGRALKSRVRTARDRTQSSQRWLERQLNDPYVAAAKRAGYRSRGAFKLAEIDDKFHLLRTGARVLDLGAAPGGWTQVAVERGAKVVSVDINPMAAVAGAVVQTLDARDRETVNRVREAMGGPADVVLSDMAAPATGHRQTDHLRVMSLCEMALDVALEILAPGGAFLAKVLRGGTEAALLIKLKRHFRTVRHVKPPSSRADSAEMYVLATGFVGPAPPPG